MAPALTVTLKAPLVAPVSPMEEAVNVYKSPVWLILRSLKVATPDEAFFVVVPDRVPPPGLFPMAIVIEGGWQGQACIDEWLRSFKTCSTRRR
jgi:hypothetical protein